MDLDTVIIYILLFAFFVLPSVLKRRKKKAAPVKGTKSGIIGKLGDGIRQFVRELEEQARVAKNASETMGTPREEGGSVWDMLDDREDAGDGPAGEPAASAAEVLDPAPPDSVPERPADPEPVACPAGSRSEFRRSRGREKSPSSGAVCPPRVRGALPSTALQQAVVWSEVLGPPKALRRD